MQAGEPDGPLGAQQGPVDGVVALGPAAGGRGGVGRVGAVSGEGGEAAQALDDRLVTCKWDRGNTVSALNNQVRFNRQNNAAQWTLGGCRIQI